MGTPLNIIIDRAMITINDYKLDDVYKTDPNTFTTILEGYMVRGLSKFDACLKPLDYNLDTHEFNVDLDMYEIDIIASWTVIEWYEGELQDVLEFKEPLRDVDFNKYSTGQNLRPRQDYIKELRIKVKQDASNYQLMNIDALPYFGKKDNANS